MIETDMTGQTTSAYTLPMYANMDTKARSLEQETLHCSSYIHTHNGTHIHGNNGTHTYGYANPDTKARSLDHDTLRCSSYIHTHGCNNDIHTYGCKSDIHTYGNNGTHTCAYDQHSKARTHEGSSHNKGGSSIQGSTDKKHRRSSDTNDCVSMHESSSHNRGISSKGGTDKKHRGSSDTLSSVFGHESISHKDDSSSKSSTDKKHRGSSESSFVSAHGRIGSGVVHTCMCAEHCQRLLRDLEAFYITYVARNSPLAGVSLHVCMLYVCVHCQRLLRDLEAFYSTYEARNSPLSGVCLHVCMYICMNPYVYDEFI
jgi:hypothetical protein